MPFENGVYWHPIAPEQRGRHETFAKAVEAAFTDLTTERNPFFSVVCQNWKSLFPDLVAWPGKFADGKLFLFVRNPSATFAVRPRLRQIAATLATLPGAPKKIELRLEIHAR